MTEPTQPWHVPIRLEDIPETGLHLDLIADSNVRAGLAALAGVADMPRIEVAIDLIRHGSGLRATGRVSATVGQTCVVTLEPMENLVEEPIDVTFATASAEDPPGQSVAVQADEPPEVLVDGAVDLGRIATEFLLLGIDPYPRKPGAEFVPRAEENTAAGPFAALAKLKDAGK